MSIWKWADWIAAAPPDARLSLGEGGTPLVRSRRIGPAAGLPALYFKLESTNPAGSFKDRFAAAAVAQMLAAGQSKCVATSSGNTGSALAAYCAAAGIDCQIAVVETAPEGKLRQARAYGAGVFKIRGFGIDPDISRTTFQRLTEWAARPDVAFQVSSYIYSPEGMTGVETISFELSEQLETIDHVFCPAGGGGLCVAVARGWEALERQGRSGRFPAVHCVQPEGNDTIAGPLRRGDARAREVECTTRVSGLQVPNINDGHLVIEHCRPTGGVGHLVSDALVWSVQRRLAREEGVFCEPAGAVALAGALQAVDDGLVSPDATIVCLVTGTGFKDDESVSRMLQGDCPQIELEQLARHLELAKGLGA